MTDHVSHRQGEDYPSEMPLPSWAADAAIKILDSDYLVLLEGTYKDEPAILLARCAVVEEAQRIELQILAVLNSTDFQSEVGVHDDSRIYKLSEIPHTDDNEVEDAG